MKSKNSLHSLIHSLDKNEKRLFNLYSKIINKNEKNYLILFKILDGMKEFDADEVRKKLGIRKNDQKLKNLNLYLKNQILQSLQIYHRNTNDRFKRTDKMSAAQMLFHKKQFREALKQYTSIEKDAIKHGDYDTAYRATKMKTLCIHANDQENNDTYKLIKKNHDNIHHYLELEMEINKIDSIYVDLRNIFYHQDITTIDQTEQIKKIKKEQLDHLNSSAIKAPLAKFLYHLILSLVYSTLEDFHKYFEENKAMSKLFDEYPFIFKNIKKWVIYINLAEYYVDTNDKDNFDKCIITINEIIKRSDSSNLIIFWKYSRIFEFHIKNTIYDIPENLQENFFEDMNEFDLNEIRFCELLLNGTITYFMRERYDQATAFLDKTLLYNIPSDHFSYLPIKVLFILLYHESKESKLRDNTLLSVRRKLRRDNLNSELLDQLFHLIQKTTSEYTPPEKSTYYLTQLIELINQNESEPLFKDKLIFLKGWVERKLA